MRRGHGHKLTVLSLVERGGEVRSFHVDNAKASTIMPILIDNIDREAKVATDEGGEFAKPAKAFPGARHSQPQGRRMASRRRAHQHRRRTTSRIFKRGMKGVYQHCSEKHLHRYLAEFDFRYNQTVLGSASKTRSGLISP